MRYKPSPGLKTQPGSCKTPYRPLGSRKKEKIFVVSKWLE